MAEKEEAGKSLVFPMQGHTNCPHCGGKERIGREKIAEMVATGDIPANLYPKGPCWSMPLFDQSKPIMVSALSITKPTIRILNIFWDVCANPECMGIYVTGADSIEQEIQIPKAPMGRTGGMEGLPKGFPFGRG